LAENGHSVTVFDRHGPAPGSQWSALMNNVVCGDIRDAGLVAELAAEEFDAAVHLVSLDHQDSEKYDPDLVSSTSVMPTWNLLNNFANNGRLKRFVYFSTIHVYGRFPKKTITEEYSPAPQTVYGLTHYMSENICNYFNAKSSIGCLNVRLSNSYGSPVFDENNCWWLVINDLCRLVFSEGQMKLLSDGSPQRDFIHMSDVCRAVEFLIEAPGDYSTHNTFHVASGKTRSILQIAHIIKDVYGERFGRTASIVLPDHSISDVPEPIEQSDKFHFDTSKMSALGYRNETDLRTGIGEMFDYLSRR